MKQFDSINTILPFIIEDSAVNAVFLKGSLASTEYDEYSDVDMYCLVNEDELTSFLARRLEYMSKYRPLIYYSEANFVGPQIVGVFDNGLHFDLYTVTLSSLKATGDIKVLYDPNELLINYKAQSFRISDDQLIEHINNIAFTLLEFEAAYNRNDLVWASRLASHIFGYLSIIIRHQCDPENALLGMKRLNNYLAPDKYKKIADAIDLIGPTYLPAGIKRIIEILENTIDELPNHIKNRINSVFLSVMIEKARNCM